MDLKIILLLGFAAVLLALVALLITDARLGSAIECDRASGVCSFTQQQLLKSWRDRVPLSSVVRAEVRVHRGRGGSPQVWVVTTGGDYFFADYVLRPNADSVAQQINDFLASTSASTRLVVSEDQRLSYWLAWSLLPIVVVLLVILGRVLFRKVAADART